MIAPIIGPDFTKSATLSGGRQATGYETGSLVQRVNNDPTNSIESANKIIGDIEAAPAKASLYYNEASRNLLGSEAKKTIYERDSKGNIVGKRDIIINGAYEANGLLGKHQQNAAMKADLENRQKILQEQENQLNQKIEANQNAYKDIKIIANAINQSSDNYADKQFKQAFGNMNGSFDDNLKGLDNTFLSVTGLDLKNAVEGYNTGNKASQTYQSLKSAGYNDADIQQLMIYANKMNNIDRERMNIRNGVLSRENTVRHANEMNNILIGQGYTPSQASYMTEIGLSLGSKGLEEQKFSLENASVDNRLVLGQIKSQAIADQMLLDEFKRHNKQKESAEWQRNKILQSNLNNQQIETKTPEELSRMEVIDWQKGSEYNYDDSKAMITFNNGDMYLIDRKDYRLNDDGKSLTQLNKDAKMIKINNNRRTVAEENEYVNRTKEIIKKNYQIYNDKTSSKLERDEALNNMKKAKEDFLKYMGINKNQTTHGLKGDLGSNFSEDFKNNIFALGEKFASSINPSAEYSEFSKELDNIMQMYRANGNTQDYSVLGASLAGGAAGSAAGSTIAPILGTAVGGVVGSIIGGGSAALGNLTESTEDYVQRTKDEERMTTLDEVLNNQQQQQQQSTDIQNEYNKFKSVSSEDIGKLESAIKNGYEPTEKERKLINFYRAESKETLKQMNIEGAGAEAADSYRKNHDEAYKNLTDSEKGGLLPKRTKIDNDMLLNSIAFLSILAKVDSNVINSKEDTNKFLSLIYMAQSGEKFDKDQRKALAEYLKSFSGKNIKLYGTNIKFSHELSSLLIDKDFFKNIKASGKLGSRHNTFIYGLGTLK